MALTVRDLPKPGEYWKRPATSEKGDADVGMVYLAVGYALTTWEHTEYGYASVFKHLMEGVGSQAERVYGSIMSPGGRRDALVKAAEIFFYMKDATTEDDKNDFKSLINHHKEATARRNDIAHGMVIGINDLGYYLLPAMYNSSKNKDVRVIGREFRAIGKKPGIFDRHDYSYTANDIHEFAKKFYDLGRAVDNFEWRLTDL